MPSAAFIQVHNIPGMSAKGLRGVVAWLRRQADYMQKNPEEFSDVTYTARYEYRKDTYKAEKKVKRAREWGDYVEGNTWGGYGSEKKKVAKPPAAKRKKTKKKPKKRRAYY